MNELIQKITASNGGVFTGQGTNTYLIGKKDITLVDPGPNIPAVSYTHLTLPTTTPV